MSLIPLSDLAAAGRSSLTGLARRAAQAPTIDARNEVTYSELPCKSLISHCESERVPFRWTINPFRGCEFGCVYCYARYTHEFMEMDRWEDFERRIFIKTNAAQALVEDLRRNRRQDEWIAIGTATDPYQPAERRYGVMRSILEAFSRYEGLRLSITTKSDLVLRDLDLLLAIGRRGEIHVNLTITTPRRELARVLEPRAPRPDLRLRAVERLNAAGIRCGVLLMPVLPRINDSLLDLDRLMEHAAAAGAAYLAHQVLFLRSSSRKRFFPFIEEHFPRLLHHYRRLYGPSPEPLRFYTEQIGSEIRRLKEKHGLAAERRAPASSASSPQPALALI